MLVDVQGGGGCKFIGGRVDDVTRAMPGGGGCLVLVNVLKAEGDDVTRAIPRLPYMVNPWGRTQLPPFLSGMMEQRVLRNYNWQMEGNNDGWGKRVR